MIRAAGIDLNGLVDQAAILDERGLRLTTGEIPAVVVVPRVQPPRARELVAVAGVEASRSLEGRGWHWPAAARTDGSATRIPVADLLSAVEAGRRIDIFDEPRDPADLLAVAACGLGAEPGRDSQAVLAVRDDGRLDEAGQQRLLDGMSARGFRTTLLWRPVAALLGLEDELNPMAAQLHGKRFGIVSVLGDGLDVCVLDIEKQEDPDGPYLVPVRHRRGVRVPFDRPLSSCAEELARSLLPDGPDAWRQLVWGGGAAIKAFLKLDPGETLVQVGGRWRMLRLGGGQDAVRLPRLDETALADARALLVGVRDLVVEGPGMEATDGGLRLGYEIRKTLVPDGAWVHAYGWLAEGLVAKGAAVYAARRAAGRKTYFDHLPRLRMAVRSGTDATFIDLIPHDARLEGGEAYAPPPRAMGIWIEEGQSEFDNYIAKGEGERIRIATARTASLPRTRTEVLVQVYQRPLAGRARITLHPQGDDGVRPIELDWDAMREDERSEEEIIAALSGGGGRAIPPIEDSDCHHLLWTTGSAPTLLDLLEANGGAISHLLTGPGAPDTLQEVAARLRRLDTLTRLTGGAVHDDKPLRPVSLDGRVPTAGDGLTHGVLEAFDRLLEAAAAAALDRHAPTEVRSRAVQVCTWSFARCPADVVEFLLDEARTPASGIPEAVIVQALGRVARTTREIDLLFGEVLRPADLGIHHIRALTWTLGRVEHAPQQLDRTSAERLAGIACRYIRTAPARTPASQYTTLGFRLLAFILRYRVVARSFLDPETTAAGAEADALLKQAETAGWVSPRNRKFAADTREFLEGHGTNDRLLGLGDS